MRIDYYKKSYEAFRLFNLGKSQLILELYNRFIQFISSALATGADTRYNKIYNTKSYPTSFFGKPLEGIYMVDRSLFRGIVAVLVLLGAWGLLALSYGRWYCPLFTLTGFPCASCGLTTALVCLLHLDWVGAWKANPLFFFLLLWSFWVARLYIQSGIIALRYRKIWLILGAALGAMAVLRFVFFLVG